MFVLILMRFLKNILRETSNSLHSGLGISWCSPEVFTPRCSLKLIWHLTQLSSNPCMKKRRRKRGVHWKDWCWSWTSNTLATLCEELTHWKRPWCWEGLGAGGEGDDREWDGWMASLTQWTWVWVNSGSWWWTGRPGMLWFMESQRVGHDWATELNWTESILN